MTEITVYSRQGCHLCEVLIEELLPLVRGKATVSVVDIDGDPALADRYGLRIPVVSMGDQELCHYHLDTAAVHRALASSSR